MAEFTDPARRADPNRRPRSAAGADRVFDPGRRWCANAAGHPHDERHHPGENAHFPNDECRSQSHFADDVRFGLLGDAAELELYAAAPFRHGQPRGRDELGVAAPRIVLEFYGLAADCPSAAVRFSVSLAEAALLARQLGLLLDRLA